VLIHPIYDTYPICTFILGKSDISYLMHFDHDHLKGVVGDLKINDHTNYPKTLDPKR
jgi:hypothetical protein